jgi:hypothetical protein
LRSEYPLSVLLDRFALAGVIVLALWVRLYAIEQPGIWYDEAYSLLLAREGPARIWQLTALDVHPPLYYVLLHYWLMIWGEGALPARALSVLADIGTLLLCIKLMSLIVTRRATWIAALLLALLPISVRYSQEVRMYTLLGFWLMAATVALVCWSQAPERKRFVVAYVLLMSAAFYTHYFAGLCVLVHWLFWWKSSDECRTSISRYLWYSANAAIVVLYLPWIPHLIAQVSGTNTWIEPVTAQVALGLVWQFVVMDGAIPLTSAWRLLPLILLVICAIALIASNKVERRFGWLLIGYFFVPAISLFILAQFTPIFLPRYLVFASPAIAMIVALALDSAGERFDSAMGAVVLGLVLCAQSYGLSVVYQQTDGMNGTDMRRSNGSRELVLAIEREVQPGDEIILDSLISYLPFSYYNTTGIQPRFHIRSSFEAFLASPVHGGYALIPDPLKWIYFHDLVVLQCGRRVWWIPNDSKKNFRQLLSKGWTQTLELRSGSMTAYLLVNETRSASDEADNSSGIKLPPAHSAQNCPPAPFATSANRTRRSPLR